MTHVAPPKAEPCVWMAAGLVSYKLCDREFDCQRCPLDGALRGGGSVPANESFLPDDGRRSMGFPDDRRYAAGHTWVATGRPGTSPVRIGLDGFAASLLPRPIGVSFLGGARELERGDVICDIELPEGVLSIRVPFGGRLERENLILREQPGLIVESPYLDGWLVDLIPRASDVALEGLLDAAQGRDRSALHLRRFRRRVARHLLADVASVGPCMADGGRALTSLSEILGAPRYLEILREVLR